jgi:hypothetical protein
MELTDWTYPSANNPLPQARTGQIFAHLFFGMAERSSCTTAGSAAPLPATMGSTFFRLKRPIACS